MNVSEARLKSATELNEMMTSLLKEQLSLHMQKAAGQLPKIDRFTKIKRDIARIKTVMSEREKAQ